MAVGMVEVRDVLRLAVLHPTLDEIEARFPTRPWLDALDACVDSRLVRCRACSGEIRYELTARGRRLLCIGASAIAGA